MPHPLPPGLQIKVLNRLRRNEQGREAGRTLATCCLVCQAWCRICQRELLSNISLRSYEQLESLLASLSSATFPIEASHIAELSLDAEANLYNVSLSQLLAMLPSLRRLNLTGGSSFKSNSLFPVYIGAFSQYVAFEQFITIIELRSFIVGVSSSRDFRGLVATLPALSNLSVERVCQSLTHSIASWTPNWKVSSLSPAPQNVTCLFFKAGTHADCQ